MQITTSQKVVFESSRVLYVHRFYSKSIETFMVLNPDYTLVSPNYAKMCCQEILQEHGFSDALQLPSDSAEIFWMLDRIASFGK